MNPDFAPTGRSTVGAVSRASDPILPPYLCPVRALLRAIGRVPAGVFDHAARWCRVNSDGEHISPEMAFTGVLARVVPTIGLGGSTPARARRLLDLETAVIAEQLPTLAVEEDLLIPTPGGAIPATRYRAATGSAGLVVFFHGGGFVLGSRASHDALVRRLAIDTGADVLSVDYRLAPEHPFPAAVDDAVAAWRFAVDSAPGWGIDTDRIVVAGDSAGGNLSAGLAQQLRGESVTPCLQLLIYPITDLTATTSSRRAFSTGYFLTGERIAQFVDQYVPTAADRTDPRASPLLADDLLGLPRAHVVVAGFDPLRDEGIAYADALAAVGVPVTLQREGGMIHAFANLSAFSPGARRAVDRMSDAVVNALA